MLTKPHQVSDIHRKKGDHTYEKGKAPYDSGETSADYNAGLPVVAFTFTDDFKKKYPHLKEDAVQNLMRAKQYIIPSMYPCSFLYKADNVGYPLPPGEEKTQILRVVVRETLSLDMIDRLVTDLCNVTESMMNTDAVDLAAWQPAPRSIEVRKNCLDVHRTLLTSFLVETTHFGWPAVTQEARFETADEGGGAPKRMLIAELVPITYCVIAQISGTCILTHHRDGGNARMEGVPVAKT